MNPGATAERVLEALRRQILDGTWRPGDRLEPTAIAGELSSSITPVRDALNRLTGEGLVEARQGGGFHLPALDEPLLQDLYRWSEQILRISVSNWPASDADKTPDLSAMIDSAAIPGETTGRFFTALVQRSGNSEHAGAVSRLNARLHTVRNHEGALLGMQNDEFNPWLAAIAKDDRRGLVVAIARYHRRRDRVAGAIVRAVYRSE